ncbi:hypothetical protein ERIC1_2c06000 [Paenibacillus larvae subsp. larvae DSM 25719]|nr:hypothetical protein ERIC1_2c06000 [Paenibacillus larvae subsp. larvae DSM 25719]
MKPVCFMIFHVQIVNCTVHFLFLPGSDRFPEETPPDMEKSIKECLRPKFEISRISDTSEQWVFSGPSITLPFRPELMELSLSI